MACKISAACHLHFESPQRARSVVLVVRPSSQHQGCSLRLPRASVVSLFFRAGCDLRGDLESVYAVLCWPLHVFLWIKIVAFLSCQQGVLHGQRPRRRFQVLAGQLTGSTCVNLDQSLRSVLFVPSHISGAGRNFGHGLSAALGETELASSCVFEGPRVRSYLVCVSVNWRVLFEFFCSCQYPSPGWWVHAVCRVN